MKCYQTKLALFLMLIMVAVTFSSCEEKNYYDPSYKKNNPLGDIEGPAGFDWKTTRSIPITVKVNDEELGAYHYLVEVFSDNPITNPDAGILTRGVAKTGLDFSSGITITPDVDVVYVQQKDPRGRIRVKAVSTTDVSEISCVFTPDFVSATKTRAASTRAQVVVEIPTHSVNDAEYKNATAWAGRFNNNTSYKIEKDNRFPTTGKGGDITLDGSAGKYLYVAGEWYAGKITVSSGVSLVVLDGGFVECTEISSSSGTSDVVIMPGGTVTVTGGKGAVIGTTNSFYCLGELNVPNGTLNAQNQNSSVLYIGPDGKVNADNIKIQNDKTYIENHGVIAVTTWSKGGGAAIVYNMCLIDIKTTADFTDIGELFIEGGVILVGETAWFAATPITMRNGAYLQAKTLDLKHECTFTGLTEANRSLVRAETIEGGGIFILSGHILSEYKSIKNTSLRTLGRADTAPHGTSSVSINSCSVTIDGNEGEEPEEPEFPIITPATGNYTFLFEDNWPLYGDYDLNDVVFKLDNIKTYLDASNKAESFTFDLTYLATGAEKRSAGALMLDMVDASNIASVSYLPLRPSIISSFDVEASGVESGQSKAVIPLFNSIHEVFGKPVAKFINTVETGEGAKDNADVVKVNMKIEFVQPVLAVDLNINHLNFFIMTEPNKYPVTSDKRREIHLVGFAPTTKADTSLFGNHNDASSAPRYYLSNNNLAWGVVVPDNFNWMIEGRDIQFGYLDFTGWVKSGGDLNKTWWKQHFDDSKIYHQY